MPVLVPIVIAAIVTGVLFAWWFPAVTPGVTPPAARFTDITEESGLAGWTAPTGGADEPATLGGGVVCFDYDGDGHDDLFFVGGAPWPWEEPFAKRVSRGSVALFHNDGTGRFTDVTAGAGLVVELQGMTAAAGDFDNDGRPDLYVTCVGTNHLFRNLGDGHFEDVTEQAGVGGEDNTWSTGATWIDVDKDGWLDLVVCHYARWASEVDLRVAFVVEKLGRSYGAPTGFVSAFPTVYRNLGDGRFAPMADGAGLRDLDPQTGFPAAKPLAVVPVDANDDGWLDLLFAYHTRANALFLNQGDGTFRAWAGEFDRRREGISTGLAAASSLPFAAANGDPRFAALRAEVSGSAGGGADAALELSAKFGVALLDYDLDGRIDMFSGNGRAESDTNRVEDARTWPARPELWWNRGNGWVATGGGEGRLPAVIARGVATADFDGDGDLDVVIAQHGGPPTLLRNDQRVGFPWLEIQLVPKRGSGGAMGARVEVHTPRRIYMQTAAPAMTFMAQSSATMTFGLGEDARVRKIVVRWPDGTRQEVRPAAVNRRMVIAEP